MHGVPLAAAPGHGRPDSDRRGRTSSRHPRVPRTRHGAWFYALLLEAFMVTLLTSILAETFHMLLLAAPFLLLGLMVAGIMHVALPSALVERWLGRPGWAGIGRAALIGVPLPICSCGVVPIAVELKRKKASDPASLAFLITTPESGADSVMLTWATMGPVMAIGRPLAAMASALLGGAFALRLLPRKQAGRDASTSAPAAAADADAPHDVITQADAHGCCQHDDNSTLPAVDAPDAGGTAVGPGWRSLVHRSYDYGFRRLFDELALWLVLGSLVAGCLSALLPDDLARYGLGAGPLGLFLMLLIGIPLYVCASASTPIAAALMAKGLSPGAALVFLLAGPATNAASLVLLARTFGQRFVQVYLGAVALGALAAGALLDLLLVYIGPAVVSPLAASRHHTVSFLEGAAFVALLALLVGSVRRGAFRVRWRALLPAWAAPDR